MAPESLRSEGGRLIQEGKKKKKDMCVSRECKGGT